MPSDKPELKEVPVDAIERPEVELRCHVDEAKIEELRRSIKRHGVLVPIIVSRTEKGYRLVAGLRRLVCAAANGLATIPAIVVAKDVEWEDWATWAENELREGVNPVDEATWIAAVLERRNLSNAQAAALFDRSEPWVSQRLAILRWPEDVRAAVRDGWLSYSAGREIAAITDDVARRYCLRTAHRLGCSTRQAESWRRNWQKERMGRGSSGSAGDFLDEPTGRAEEAACLLCDKVCKAHEGMVHFTCNNCLSIIQSVLNQEKEG